MANERVQGLLVTNDSQASNNVKQKLTDAGIKFSELKVESETVEDVTGSINVPVIIAREGDFGGDRVDQFLEIKDNQKRLGVS